MSHACFCTANDSLRDLAPITHRIAFKAIVLAGLADQRQEDYHDLYRHEDD